MEFKALRVATLTEDVADKLEASLTDLPGVTDFTIALATKEVSIVFDENQLSFRALVKVMTEAGCPLQRIDAALLL